MQAVVFTDAGGNEVIEVQEHLDFETSWHRSPGPDFAGLNPADIQQRDGNYPPPVGAPVDVSGLEVAGTVQAVGQRVTSIHEGDRVFGIVSGGGLATQVLAQRKTARFDTEFTAGQQKRCCNSRSINYRP